MTNAWTGKRALICGSTQGIGKATAIALAAEGASVTLLARNAEKLEAVRKELPIKSGASHGSLAVDMDGGQGFTDAIKGLGEFDILVNNTGGPPPGAAHEAEVEDFKRAFAQHLASFQILVRAFVPGMKTRRSGRIINVISTSVKQPLPNLGVSNTIRGAVANWGKTLAMELGPFGITVNNVLPGATETERLGSIIANKARRTGMPESEVKEEMLQEIPLRRFARPEEIAAAIVFLAGPDGAYINGINLPVDGGRTGCL